MTETSQATGPEAAAGPKDFSRPRTRKVFTVDGDRFEAVSAIPGETFVEYATLWDDFQGSGDWAKDFEALISALELVLHPESFALLRSRLTDKERPVDIDQMADIVLWLLEEYGLRPTQPPSPSSDGSENPEPGTSSTESTPPEEPTSEPSGPTGS